MLSLLGLFVINKKYDKVFVLDKAFQSGIILVGKGRSLRYKAYFSKPCLGRLQPYLEIIEQA
jgi:hypothetical protein